MSTPSSDSKSKATKLLSIYKTVSIALAAANILLGLLCYILFYDSDVGYFNGSAPVTVFYILLAATVCFAISAGFVLPKKSEEGKISLGNSKLAYAAIPGMGFLLYALSSAYIMFVSKSFAPTEIISAVCALLAFIYFVTLVRETKLSLTSKVLLGLTPTVWALFVIVSSYFDYTVEMNSPDKLLLQFAALSVMLCMTTELRFTADNPRPRLYVASACIAMSLCGTGCVSGILSAVAKQELDIGMITTAIVFLTLFIYVTLRLLSLSVDGSSDSDGGNQTQEAESSEDAEKEPSDTEA